MRKWTVDQEDALYNALLGFISGGLSEGGTVATEISANIAQRTHATEATPNFVINHNNISSIDGKPNSPSSNTASDTVATLTGSLQSSPQTDVAVSGENTDNLSTRQVLAQAIENMGSRPMDPKTYNALFSYKNKLEQYNRTAALLAQAQQQSPGAAPSNVTQLKKLLVKQEARLAQAEGSPELQPIANKTRAEIVENNRKNVVDISRIFDRIKAEGDIITDGSHIENGKLKPNVTYQTGEYDYLYQTDGMGRICRAIAKHLKRKTPGKRKDHYRKTPGKLPGDEAGHLIADRFGGSRKLDNLVSQAKDVNRKEFGHLEDLWAKAIAQGKEVSVDIQFFYDGDGKRPVGFQIDYAIDGVPANANIINDNGGATNNG